MHRINTAVLLLREEEEVKALTGFLAAVEPDMQQTALLRREQGTDHQETESFSLLIGMAQEMSEESEEPTLLALTLDTEAEAGVYDVWLCLPEETEEALHTIPVRCRFLH